MGEMIKLRYPKYFKEFNCIGKKCTDICCVGWEIEVDKFTFNQYKNVSDDREIKSELEKNIEVNLKVIDETIDYAKILLNKEKKCPFLDVDSYCKIYKELGEEYLGNVCTSFPRILNKVDDIYEISLDISCPHAAEMILRREEITFAESDEELGKSIIWNKIDTSEKFNWLSVEFFSEIRRKSLEIIKNRSLDLDKRIINLGYFIKDVEEVYEIGEKDLKKYIEEYEFIEYKIRGDKTVDKAEFLQIIIKFLEVEKNTDSIILINKTKELLREKKKEENFDEIVLENYLVNYMFSSLFPFSEIESIFDGFIMLIVRYILFRVYSSKNIDENILIMQKLSKIISHNKNYAAEILNYVKDNELDNLKLTYFLKKSFD
ncbi:MAG: flagellin lysine-N-methylase [Clostridium sp.]|uniref:flagellin lysine-N-methylase n=1 Tax=Clostridium sp. TaxID=1506 RepID=UPI003F36866B